MKLHQLYFLAGFYIPKGDSAIRLTPCHNVFRVWGKSRLEVHNSKVVETRSEFVQLIFKNYYFRSWLTFLPSKASIRFIWLSVEPSNMKLPLNENFKNLISGISSMLKMLKGFYWKVINHENTYTIIVACIEEVNLLDKRALIYRRLLAIVRRVWFIILEIYTC